MNKISQARVGNAWFLRSDWSAASQGVESHLTDVAWLRFIADPKLIR